MIVPVNLILNILLFSIKLVTTEPFTSTKKIERKVIMNKVTKIYGTDYMHIKFIK